MELEPKHNWNVAEIVLGEMLSKRYELIDLPILYFVLSQIAVCFLRPVNMQLPNIQLS